MLLSSNGVVVAAAMLVWMCAYDKDRRLFVVGRKGRTKTPHTHGYVRTHGLQQATPISTFMTWRVRRGYNSLTVVRENPNPPYRENCNQGPCGVIGARPFVDGVGVWECQ